MEIEQTLQGVQVELNLTLNAPEGWGTEVMKDHHEWGELFRDYNQLERHIVEMVEEGYVEVEAVESLHAAREKENVVLRVTEEDVLV